MIGRLLSAALVVVVAASQARATDYKGICEASAGAFIDDNHFVVASDETNKLQLYRRGNPEPIGSGIDMQPFTTFDKSDLEAAAIIGDRVYWMSSHSFNSGGKDREKRKVFFATRIAVVDGKPTLVVVGNLIKTLRDPFVVAAGIKAGELNIEGLAATPEGELLVGLRGPISPTGAFLVPFRNPAAVVDQGAAPDFGKALQLDLGGRGIRSMELVSRNPARYVIVAGPLSDAADGFAIFSWSGPGTTPTKIDGLDIAKIKPEGAMVVSGQNLVQLLSDDGDICSDEDDPVDKRRFRSADISLP